MSCSLLASLLLLPVATAQTLPPGAVVPEALVLQVTPEGIDQAEALVPALVPSEIPVDDQSGGYGGSGFSISYTISNLWIRLTPTTVDLTPGNGSIALHFEADVQVNEPADPFILDYSGEAFWIPYSDTCPTYVEPFPVTMDATLSMAVVPDGKGGNVLDATVSDLTYSYALDSSKIQMDCWIQDLEDLLGYAGLSIYDLIIDSFASSLDSQVQDLAAQIEAAIEDGFASATVDQVIEVGEGSAHLLLEPSDVVITPSGVELFFSGSADADPAACIAEVDPGGSPETVSPPPLVDALPPGTHAAALASDDFVNEVLYALWRGGVLCYTAGGDLGGFTINTALLPLFVGAAFDDIFPETADMLLATRPQEPLVAAFGPDHDVQTEVRELGLDFIGDVDDRMARFLQVSVDAPVGADLAFDGTTGELAVDLALDSSTVAPTVTYNPISTTTDTDLQATVEANFGTLLDSLLDPLLGSVSLSYAIPGFEGVGLTSLEAAASGAKGDWLEVDAAIGEVTYATSSGCSADGSSSGCSDGCSGTGCGAVAPLGGGWFAAPLALLVLRRRRAPPA